MTGHQRTIVGSASPDNYVFTFSPRSVLCLLRRLDNESLMSKTIECSWWTWGLQTHARQDVSPSMRQMQRIELHFSVRLWRVLDYVIPPVCDEGECVCLAVRYGHFGGVTHRL